MIIKNQKYKSEDLRRQLYNIMGHNYKTPEKKLINLSQNILIQFILDNEILDKEKILQYYYDFRDSQNPVFFMLEVLKRIAHRPKIMIFKSGS